MRKKTMIAIILFSIIMPSYIAIADTELDQLQNQKTEMNQQIEQKNTEIEYVQEELTEMLLKVEEVTNRITTKEQEIEELSIKEANLQNYIDETEKTLEKLNEEYNQQKALLEARLVALYETGDTSYIDVLLKSKGITDFLSNYYLISEIATTDTELLNHIKIQKNKIQELDKELISKKTELEQSRSDREKMSIALSNIKLLQNNYLGQLTEKELQLHTEIQNYQSQVRQVELEILSLTTANVGTEYIGGQMLWPVPGYTRITSSFGMRTHPITGVYKLHTGTDIGAPRGADFIAANDGVVVKAGMNAAYGNMVIIDHGGGISTLYAHGSEILVEVGQTVKAGTPILKVGSTGYSTGPHAHFEVRVNGKYVDPLQYITSYTNQEQNTEAQVVELN